MVSATRPTVTFPAAGNHGPFTGTKLYCLVTEANVCEQLTEGCYLKVERLGRESNALTITPTTKPSSFIGPSLKYRSYV